MTALPMTLGTLTFSTPLTGGIAAGLAAAFFVSFLLLRWFSGPPSSVSRRLGLIALRAASCITLLVILLNPSDRTEQPGPIDRPDMFYLLDSSQSMSIGDAETRFDHAARMMREAEQVIGQTPHANVKLFRFGHRLAAIDDPAQLGLTGGETSLLSGPSQKMSGSPGSAYAAEVAKPQVGEKPLKPTDSDTQLMMALSQASSRFGRRPPAGLVVFSDGRTRDEAGVEQFLNQFSRLKIPVHVVPVGDFSSGGDVAIVAAVVPPRVRRYTDVEVQIFLRSYGYDGRRCEVTLTSTGDDGVEHNLAPPAPVTLRDGFQSAAMTFRSDAKTRHIKIRVADMPREVSLANNSFETEVGIDRTKIRVLYVEGSSQPLQYVQQGAEAKVRGPFSDLQQALTEDEDIECVVLSPQGGRGALRRLNEQGGTLGLGFASTVAELSAFDALILSDCGASTFTEEQLEWIEAWVGQRGAGLMMVGGQQSFGAGGWDDTPVAAMLPVEIKSGNDWVPGTQVSVQAASDALRHPLWQLSSDELQNRDIVRRFPSFFGANRWETVRPNLAEVLAVSDLSAAQAPSVPRVMEAPAPELSFFERLQQNLTGKSAPPVDPQTAENVLEGNVLQQPAIVAGRYGQGRTMVMSMPITAPWANELITNWSTGETRHFAKFWRNAIYWLTESSSIGRRRLVVTADKKFYRPGETIRLSANAYNEAANRTGGYRIAGMIEPQASLSDLDSNYAPVRWPDGRPRESGETSPFIAWGEEFDLPRADSLDGSPAYALEIPVADALSIGSASQSLRVEVTALEEYTQVDSTSLDIQILHDPFEQQNPFPNHELLASIAKQSGGSVINTPRQLADVLTNVEMHVGEPIVKSTPLWSSWLLWTWLIVLLTAEWIWRRAVGLA